MLTNLDLSLPNLNEDAFRKPGPELLKAEPSRYRPRILLLYGSVRERSYSRFMTLEAARLLDRMGAEPKIFHPDGLPLPDDAPVTHPKVIELRELVEWSEGHVWCSPERHGAMTGVMKSQIDWLPLNSGAVRLTQGKTLAVGQQLAADDLGLLLGDDPVGQNEGLRQSLPVGHGCACGSVAGFRCKRGFRRVSMGRYTRGGLA